jgi:dTDP-4-amino-4,6-dideoxygalactose transaminase
LKNNSDSELPPKVLGGVFGLESVMPREAPVSPPFSDANTSYFLNLRCALSVFCDVNRPKSVWLPAHLCGDLLDPFVSKHIPIRYYGVDANLAVEADGWVDRIEQGDLVVPIHYFGFPMAGFPAARAASRGATIVEDASQALFLPQQFPQSSCIVYSPRKFMGVPDGGIMVSRRVTGTETVSLAAPPQRWWRGAFAAVQKRRDFDIAGGPNEWFPLFQRSESEFPLGSYRASELSTIVLSYGTDYEAIRLRRRENYSRLLERLSQYALFPDLGSDTVPVGFPVRVEEGGRDQVLQYLYAQRIYPPVHWRLDGVVPVSFENAYSVSRSTMTLICDQRYTLQDMDRQADQFLEALVKY